ncbi:MAG: flagellar export chaperone FlgN [Planctomycetota bacterium]
MDQATRSPNAAPPRSAPASRSPTDALAELVRQKRRLLEQMLRVGERQGELIESGDVTALVQLLASKQQLVTGLQVVERALDAHRHEDPALRPWPSEAARSECAADAEACNALLATVIATDQRHECAMHERRDAIAQQLRVAQTAHAASTAYKPHIRSGAPTPVATTPTPLSDSLDLTAGS